MSQRLFYLVCSLLIAAGRTAWAEDPTALLFSAPDVIAPGTSYSFVVMYSDDGAVDGDSIDDDDIRVTGPNGFNTATKLISAQSIGTSDVKATYAFVPPGGTWDSSDNGTYSVVMQAKQVFDPLANAVHGGILGTFNVSVAAGALLPAQLLNISTRLQVQTGTDVLIGGFIIAGSDQKKVLARALGPSLPVNGSLADPILELHSSSAVINANDNWKDSQQAEIQGTTIPPSNDAESAIAATLPANNSNYTAVVAGKNNTTGVALVELYDLAQSAASHLANISTRGLVKTGNSVMIAGLILGPAGNLPAKVLIRGIGPSLGGAGVANPLQDPILELHDGNGATLQVNDNWRTDQEAEIIATTVPPSNDRESAIVRTLAPGNYTAIVRGVGDTTGVALVEVYGLQ